MSENNVFMWQKRAALNSLSLAVLHEGDRSLDEAKHLAYTLADAFCEEYMGNLILNIERSTSIDELRECLFVHSGKTFGNFILEMKG